jgi:tetratricopeptide (TPR) repeat protein
MEVAQLSASMLGTSGQQSDVLVLLAKETEGNVFFLLEVARALAEEAGSLSNIGQVTLPTKVFTGGMRQILRRRIERLPADFQPLLQLAAVVGRQVDITLLRHVAPAVDVEKWLYQCASVTVLNVQDNRWQFAHDKLREAVLAELPDEERADLHRGIAEAIESVYPDDDERATALVHHWNIAGDTQKEWHYAQIAGERAYTISAFPDAINLFGRALEITSQQDVKSQAVLLVKLGKSYEGLGDYPMATQHLMQGLVLSRTVGDGETEVEALNGLSWISYQQGGFNEAERYAEQALAQKPDNRQRIARSLNILGVVASNRGNFEAAQHYFEESLAVRRIIDDRRGIANSVNNLGMVASNRGNFEAAQRYFEESQVLCREIGYRQGIANTLNNQGEVADNRGNHEAAWRYLGESLEIYREIGNRRGIALSLSNLGHVAVASDDTDAALRCYRGALSESTEIGAVSLTLAALAGFARLLMQNRHYKRAAELLGLALDHPSIEVDVKHGAKLPLTTLREKIPADELEGALERGKSLDLDTVVQEILNEFTPS